MTGAGASPLPYAATLEGLGRTMTVGLPMARPEPKRGGLRQLDIPDEVVAKIKAAMADAVADGIEEGVQRVQKRYSSVSTWSKVSVGATVIGAAATVGLLIWLVWKKK